MRLTRCTLEKNIPGQRTDDETCANVLSREKTNSYLYCAGFPCQESPPLIFKIYEPVSDEDNRKRAPQKKKGEKPGNERNAPELF
jgi:hypothetical protein